MIICAFPQCAVLEEISDVTEEQRRSMASSRNQLFADEDRGASDAATPATGQRARKKKKRMDPLMPRALGPCFWNDGPSREGAAAEVRDFLLRFSARVLAPEGQGLKLDWTEVEQDIAQVQEEIRNPPAPVPAPATGEATGVTTTTSTTCSSSPASCPPPNSTTAAPDLSVPKKRGRKSAASSVLSPASAVESSSETPSSSSPSSTRSVDAVQLPALIQMVHGAKKSVSVLSSDFVARYPATAVPLLFALCDKSTVPSFSTLFRHIDHHGWAQNTVFSELLLQSIMTCSPELVSYSDDCFQCFHLLVLPLCAACQRRIDLPRAWYPSGSRPSPTRSAMSLWSTQRCLRWRYVHRPSSFLRGVSCCLDLVPALAPGMSWAAWRARRNS